VSRTSPRRGFVTGPGWSRKIDVMTDLLSPAARRTSSAGGRPRGRPLVLTAFVGGVVSAGSTVLVAIGVALAGWFAADAGRYGDTRDAMRVGADAWLMAHGADLHLDSATVTLLPLGVTLLCVYVAYRVGVWAAATSAAGDAAADLRPVVTGVGVQAATYAVCAFLAAVLAAHPRAESAPAQALLGGFVLSVLAGGGGLLAGSGQGAALWRRSPVWLRSVLAGASATLLVLFAAGCFLVGAALVSDFGTAATVLSRLHADGPGGLMYTVVGVLFLPNAALLGLAYLLGPGFAIGTGTVVSPTAVMIGPVPAFPLLAALPADGATPAWTTALMGLPVLLALVGVVLAARVAPVARFEVGAMCGLAAGLLAAVALTALVSLAGGAAGPGRMADIGADPAGTFLAAAVSLGGGGLVGGVLAVWRARRRARAELSTAGTAAG
jgi:hypothetical protein